MKLVNNTGAAAVDRISQEKYGIPGDILMENAGIRIFDALVKEYHPEVSSQLVFIVGGGNNAGDALVMARQAFVQGFRKIAVVRVKKNLRGLAARWLDVLQRLGIQILSFEDHYAESMERIMESQLIIDGITGTGLSGPLRGDLSDVVEAVNGLDISQKIVAVDAPSGIGDDFRPDYPVLSAGSTLTVYPAKSALYKPSARLHCGKIIPVEIGFPPQAVQEVPGWILMDDDELKKRLRPFSPGSYKNSRGHVSLYAGSPGTLGAALLAAEAAGRGGSGLVSLFCDPEVYTSAASQMRSVMVKPWSGDIPGSELKFQSCVIGPGWGTSGRKEVFQRLLKGCQRGVIDADGLTLLSGMQKPLEGEWVLTPHPGEAARLLGCSSREITDDCFGAAEEISRRYNAFVLLKSHVSCLRAPDGRFALIDGMNPLMGTGGSGDILCGFIGGLMADTGLDPFDAAAAGAYLHQKAGSLAAREDGVFISEDLLKNLSRVTGEYRYEQS